MGTLCRERNCKVKREFPESLARKPEVIFQEAYDGTTNQRVELRACIRAL